VRHARHVDYGPALVEHCQRGARVVDEYGKRCALGSPRTNGIHQMLRPVCALDQRALGPLHALKADACGDTPHIGQKPIALCPTATDVDHGIAKRVCAERPPCITSLIQSKIDDRAKITVKRARYKLRKTIARPGNVHGERSVEKRANCACNRIQVETRRACHRSSCVSRNSKRKVGQISGASWRADARARLH